MKAAGRPARAPDLMHSRPPGAPPPRPISHPSPRPAGPLSFCAGINTYHVAMVTGRGFFPGRVSPLGLFMLSAVHASVDGCRRSKEPEDGSFEGRRHQMKHKGHGACSSL